MTNKNFLVTIELDTVEFKVTAKNRREARKKALTRLSRNNPVNLIRRHWPNNKKEIDIDEL